MKDVQGFLERLSAAPDYHGQLAHVERVPPRHARFADLDPPLPPPLREALDQLGIQRLYTHQAEAVRLVRDGKDVVFVSSPASGKTLCYNLPVLEDLLAGHEISSSPTALYLFPTKALSQDQLKGLRRLCDAGEELSRGVRAGVYDGDTPQTTRRKLRDEGNILFTNPDMLHSGILPYHTRWARFLANLRTVVVDEVHTYRGVFGSNVANLLRRLNRLCRRYGSEPRYICCSATIANPKEFGDRLTGRDLQLVADDGAPRGERWFVLWNPPLREDSDLDRLSSNVEAERLMVRLVREGVQTIAFGRARVVAELLYKYVRDQLRLDEPALANSVRAYRGGYLPAERRNIEQMLFNGQLLGVTSTNALELGVDIGGLDAAIIVGFPGSIASTLQQAGRAGRSAEPALIFFVAYNEPVDQFIIRNPQYLLAQSPESAIIDPENPYILAGHLGCAAAESPLRASDCEWFGSDTPSVADALAEEGTLKRLGDAHYWARPEQPAHRVGLRLASTNTVTIIDTTRDNAAIANVDRISAPELVYPGAVYLHEAEIYLVEQLDLENQLAYVRREDVDYYTQATLESSIQICGEERSQGFGPCRLAYGEVAVRWATVGFKKIQFYSTDSLGWSGLDLPSQELRTMGMWLVPDPAFLKLVRSHHLNPVEGLVGIRNACIHMLPLLAMCDRTDIGGMVDTSNLGTPTMFVYDRYPGGVGFAERASEQMDLLMEACLRLIEACACSTGCPACVGLPNLRPPIHGDPDAGGAFPIPHKAAAILMLRRLSAVWKEAGDPGPPPTPTAAPAGTSV